MQIIYTSIIAPVSKEIICRGKLMTSQWKVKRKWLDVLVSAAIFGAHACFAERLGNDRFRKVFWNAHDILHHI